MTRTLTVMQALRWATQRLAEAGIDEARLDARVLLQDCLGLDHAGLAVSPYRPLQPDDLAVYQYAVERRAAREPLAYVVGHREFFGLDLNVDQRVLIPRPETELLVEEALSLLEAWGYGPNPPAPFPAREGGARVTPPFPRGEGGPGGLGPYPCTVDVGTGSGAIAVSLAKRCPTAFVYALDVSAGALAVAETNARLHDVEDRLAFLQGDLLEPLDEPADLIAANLPYVTTAELANPQPEVAREPRLALDGGPDGLDVYRRLLEQAPGRMKPSAALLLEIGAAQGPTALELAERAFPDATVRLRRDLAGLDRVVIVERKRPGC